MTRDEVLEQVIERGIAEVLEAYPLGSSRQIGAMEGFEVCRGKTPEQMIERLALMELERRGLADRITEAEDEDRSDYWRHRYAMLQVEWCLNCLAAWEWMNGAKSFTWLPAQPTLRAYENVARAVAR